MDPHRWQEELAHDACVQGPPLVPSHFDYYILVLAYKVLHGIVPEYLRELLVVCTSSLRCLLSAQIVITLVEPRIIHATRVMSVEKGVSCLRNSFPLALNTTNTFSGVQITQRTSGAWCIRYLNKYPSVKRFCVLPDCYRRNKAAHASETVAVW